MSKPITRHWVGSWTSTPDPVDDVAVGGRTVRVVAHLSLGGARVRVRLSNAYGDAPLTIGAARIGLRREGADIVPNSDQALTFGGSASTEIAAGALVLSDPLDMDLPPLADLAVSIYLPGPLTRGFRLTGLDGGHQTSYLSPTGDATAAAVFPIDRTVEAFLFVTAVEVLATRDVGGIVAFGDSLTEGNLSTLDANARWPDQLARRLAERAAGRRLSVMNQGLGGNRLLHDGRGDNALRRFDRDVLAQPGATHVIVLLGINDLRNSSRKPGEVVDAEQIIAGLRQIADRARAGGLVVYGATVLPWENETFKGGSYTEAAEAERRRINTWIREGDTFDGVIDFEAAIRDPDRPSRMLPAFDSGDHLHPNDAGYRHLGDSIDLALFDRAAARD